jgi:hypothetical protein
VTHSNVLCTHYRKKYGQDADDKEQDATAVNGLENETGDEEGGEKGRRQRDGRDGEKDGQEKDNTTTTKRRRRTTTTMRRRGRRGKPRQ